MCNTQNGMSNPFFTLVAKAVLMGNTQGWPGIEVQQALRSSTCTCGINVAEYYTLAIESEYIIRLNCASSPIGKDLESLDGVDRSQF